MILQFEWSGADTTGSTFAYKLQTPLNLTKLVLKSVAVYTSESLLDGMTPLYLNMDFLGQNHAFMTPATYEDSSGRVNDVDNGRVAIGTVNDIGIVQQLNLTLIDTETHFEHGKTLAFGLEHRAVTSGESFSYAAITALSGSEFTDDFRVVATFETIGGSQEPQSAA
jgi:hypothetical protein